MSQQNNIESEIENFSENDEIDQSSINNSLVSNQKNLQVVETTQPKISIKQTDLAFIAGKRGSGKTNLLIFIIKILTELGAPLLIIDPVLDVQKELFKLYGRKDPRIVHIPYQDRVTFDKFLMKVFKAKWKGFLIIDEADGFFPNREKLTKIEKFFIHIGRHYGVGSLLVTRRLANMHTDICSQANKIMIFKHWQRADLDYLSESGLVEILPYVKSLKKYHFVYVNTDEFVLKVCDPVTKMK